MKLTQASPTASTGTITVFYKSTGPTSSLDNATFLSKDAVTFVQDAGDGLHTQLNALDSGFVFDVNADYSNPANKPVRWLAEGRDPSATIDASTATGNDGDNEITALTSPTATRVSTASSAPRLRTSATRSGAGSTRSSTATTTPGRCCRRAARATTGKGTRTTTDP